MGGCGDLNGEIPAPLCEGVVMPIWRIIMDYGFLGLKNHFYLSFWAVRRRISACLKQWWMAGVVWKLAEIPPFVQDDGNGWVWWFKPQIHRTYIWVRILDYFFNWINVYLISIDVNKRRGGRDSPRAAHAYRSTEPSSRGSLSPSARSGSNPKSIIKGE